MSAPTEPEFVCYHCKSDDCGNCVGISCQCACPVREKAGEMACCFKGCESRGKPQEGFDFFMCIGCGEVLALLLNQTGQASRIVNVLNVTIFFTESQNKP
jgi:hypothetical protein